MQGQRSSIESLPETFEFEHGSSSNSSGMDQQIYWNTVLNQVETQNIPNYLLPPSDSNMRYMDISDQDNTSMNIWSPGGPSSRHDETKMEHEWTSLAINAGGVPMIEERRFDGANMSINLNSSQFDDGHPFSQNYNLNDAPQNPEHNVGSDGDERPGSSLDGRRLACKRKTIEGFPGQSSASGSASFFHQNDNSLSHSIPAAHSASTGLNLSISSDFLSGANSSEQQLNPRLSTIVRGMASDCYPSPSLAGNAESAHRNFRMRINPGHQHDTSTPNLYTQGSAIRRSSAWLPNQTLESRPVIANLNPQSQPHIAVIPGLPRTVHPFPWNGASDSRLGSSSNIIPEERLIATRDDSNSRSIPRNSFAEHSLFVPTANGYVVQDPTSWSLANGSTSLPGNMDPTSTAGTSSGLHSPIGPSWVPHQSTPTQYPRSLSEVVRRSLFTSGGSETRGQSSNFPPQRSGHSSTSQEIGPQPVGFHGHQQPYMRPAFLIERQSDGVLGVPLSMRSLPAGREGRYRVISEIRNALDLMRRGEHLRFEDVFILDQSHLYGSADLHDRHRDMRLDVDNMSYEELLALEERIGYVSTGLSEETVPKCLKYRKYLSMRMGASMEEPCCICQEEYAEGEDLASLDCGHDFHTACIKQWLMRKNMCPVCKTTALVK